jgi:signal transduction histidine kinase
MHVWRFEPASDRVPEGAQAGDLDGRRAVFVAAASKDAPARAWMAVDDYDGDEATLLFGAPSGDGFRDYVGALLPEAIEEATSLGFSSLLAHWRGGWAVAEQLLRDHGFAEAAPGMWRRRLSR